MNRIGLIICSGVIRVKITVAGFLQFRLLTAIWMIEDYRR
jgi:hypothetical protein